MAKQEIDADVHDTSFRSEERVHVKEEETIESCSIFPKDNYILEGVSVKEESLSAPAIVEYKKAASLVRFPENRELNALALFSKQLKHPKKKIKLHTVNKHDSIDSRISNIASLASSVSLKTQYSTVNLLSKAKAQSVVRRSYDSGVWPVKAESIEWCSLGTEEDPAEYELPVHCNQPSSFIPQIDIVSRECSSLPANETNVAVQNSLQMCSSELREALATTATKLSRDFRPPKDIEQHKCGLIDDEMIKVGLVLNTCHFKRRKKFHTKNFAQRLINLRELLINAQIAGFSKEAIDNTTERLKAMGLLADQKNSS
ncbi:hypothetical protein DSO57_1012991 [Entomophthora muscae]|uniref:Uncharacterized protein n=1 Tax=Entomophthora muscae TaxID=34485 RepID=A0ACC2UFV5_9FUNG|nr:hypothetical protein DSO57_1012991 [Entomophthora muscae]